MKSLKFKNFTDRDFTHPYDGVPYTFKAGEAMFLEDFKAYHFVKHLVDREMNHLKLPTNNMSERAKLERQCIVVDEPVAATTQAPVVAPLKTKKNKKVEEEEFADLNKK